MTSAPLTSIGTARAILQGIRPAFLRDTIPTDEHANPLLPDEFYLLDLITAPASTDFDTHYTTITLQVGAWTRSLIASQALAVQAQEALFPHYWKLAGFGPHITDGPYRGVIMTLERADD